MIKWTRDNPKKSGTVAIGAAILSTFAYSHRSILNLQEVREPLQIVAECAVRDVKPPLKFIVIDGGRTQAEQDINLANGKSWVKHSRHQDGAAIDFMATIDGKGTYDPAPYYVIVKSFNKCSLENNIPIIWGGEWKVKDLMHIELDKKVYP